MLPTTQQQAVIDYEEGRAVVFAVAGSGKTSTVTRRIERLILVGNIQPNRILATTFGKEARRQVEEKLSQLDGCGKVDVRTLHSMAFKIYAQDRDNLPPKIKADDNELSNVFYRTLDRIRKGAGVNLADVEVDREKIEETSYSDFSNYLMQLKGDMLATPWMHEKLPSQAKQFFDIEEFKGSPWLQVLVDTCEDERKSLHLMGFDDIMVNAVVRLGSNDQIRRIFSNMYEFIIVDEYQDVNKAQNLMLGFMDESRQNMMVVGDDDQTIYEWRGARPAFIKQKLTDAAWTVFKLDRNFRSSPGPVVLASQVIKKNRERAEKSMMATKPFSGVLDVRGMSNDRSQAEEIVNLVKRYTEDTGDLNETVVLIRQYAETPLIEQSLIEAQIRYEIPGSEPFYSRRETGHILAYLQLLRLEYVRTHGGLSGEDRDICENLWSRIYTRPKTYMKRTELYGVIRKALSEPSNLSIVDLLDDVNQARIENGDRLASLEGLIKFFGVFIDKDPLETKASDVIQSLESSIDIRNWIIETAIHPTIGKVKAQIIDALTDYAYEASLEDFLESIERIKKVNETAKKGNSEPTLKILTVFKSKGLEFSNVIIPNANSAPLGGFNERTSARNSPSTTEEERRIFYVAMTRAIHNLHIFHTSPEPSPYLTEADYADVLTSIGNLRKVFEGDLTDVDSKGPEFFANSIVARMTQFQLGNACARTWGNVLDKNSILKRLEQGNQWLAAAGASIKGNSWEHAQQERIQREWTKICNFAISRTSTSKDIDQKPGFSEPVSQAYLFDKEITVAEIDFE